MAIVNATPDSFSDGGQYADPPGAISHALHCVKEGADIVDVGGESTRPGAEPVGADEEIARVVPVIEGIRKHSLDILISVDTRKSEVAERAEHRQRAVEGGVAEGQAAQVAAQDAGREIRARAAATMRDYPETIPTQSQRVRLVR